MKKKPYVSRRKEFEWRFWVQFKNIYTCECCSEIKTCGQITKLKYPEKPSKFDYTEKIP